ncbi:putative DNA binding domain-containing protein [Oscillochloris sp. ZM17-4]|uniref:ATP-binding protein n=1 Tax=Oscillochloris sp. ZM17-4 TaxID=2866714 RepID=UPI001C72D269|nr:ATP-binding protein [Oscillochloris sp. ZM17-4]MBX0329138.1 putative DNA binding domain-containing protein [Oscillochloris sp. ZM17-4]
MDHEEIAALLASPEGPRLAFARERTRLDELAETLVAFANAQGGELLLGVSGRARAKAEGLADVAAARELLQEAALACTPPLILPLPRAVRHGEAALLLASVPAGLSQVYSLHGKYLRREGGTNQPLTPDALRRLLAERGDVSWERGAPAGAAADELDPHKVSAYARRVGPEAESDPMALLRRRGCVGMRVEGEDKSSPSTLIPTNAGLLLFGRSVEERYPQAEITLVHYRGRDMGDAFEREDVRDTLPEAARRAERWLMEHMRKGSRMVGLERQDWTQFPAGAVREALVNAVAHRDYSVRGEGVRIGLFADRLECYSPGRLPGHVTLENLVAERFSRNESLVQVLADLGLIERLGYGIDRMLRQMEGAGLPPPQFRETAAGFLVTLQGQPVDGLDAEGLDTREWVRQGLSERQIAALVFLAEQRRITNRDLQELHPDVSAETIRRDLADLVERGVLLRVGEKRATYYIMK